MTPLRLETMAARLDFDPGQDQRFTQGASGRTLGTPGRAPERWGAYFEPSGEPAVVVQVGSGATRRTYLLHLRHLVQGVIDAEDAERTARAGLPPAFFSTPAP